MKLQEQFKRYFAARDTVTTREAMAWYQQAKGGKAMARFAGLYLNVLQPMLKEGSLERVDRGLYRLLHKDLIVVGGEGDEWDKYIRSKIEKEVT